MLTHPGVKPLLSTDHKYRLKKCFDGLGVTYVMTTLTSWESKRFPQGPTDKNYFHYRTGYQKIIDQLYAQLGEEEQ